MQHLPFVHEPYARPLQLCDITKVLLFKTCGTDCFAWPQGPAAASRRWLSRDHVWPAAWLPLDFPTARLLTLEYLAPVSGWEVRACM